MSEPLVEAAGLQVALGHRSLIRELDLRLELGERVALMGASDSGKSLTALAVLGLLGNQFDVRGSLRVRGKSLPWRQPPGRRPGMAAVFQDPRAALNPLVRLDRQLVPAVARRRRIGVAAASELVLDLLAGMGFEDPDRILGSYSSQLSGGQRQRACLALAMASAPDLLVADEPTTALDMVSQHQVLNALRRCTGGDHAALLLITHDLAVAATLCDRAVVLQDGTVVEAGSMRSLITTPQAPFTAALVAAARGWSASGPVRGEAVS